MLSPLEPWAPFYRSLILLCAHRSLSMIRPSLSGLHSRVYLDWDALPPFVRVDCQVEIWKIRTDLPGLTVLHTTDGTLVTSALQSFPGTPKEFLLELSDSFGPIDDQQALACANAAHPLLDELERYLGFASLLHSAFLSLTDLRLPADALSAANASRLLLLGDDIDHSSRSNLLASLSVFVAGSQAFRSQLLAHLSGEPHPALRALCQSEFDLFDRELDAELSRADKLARTSAEPPRRRPTPRPR